MSADARAPRWVEDAIFYQVFPDRFARSERVKKLGRLEAWDAPPSAHGFKGGDLLGLRERLDWIVELGANALYLNPIFPSAANHRYHTTDFFHVDPALGGDRAFRELLDACHARNVRVIIDGVFNHVGRGFFAFHDVLENGRDSRFLDWFSLERVPVDAYGPEAPTYATWAGHASLPKLRLDQPEVAEYVFEVAEHWARFGIDGWRFDTPEQVVTPGFWQELRARVKAVNPELYLVGEIWTDPRDWISPRGPFDAVLGYWFGGRTLAFAAQNHLDLEVCRAIDYPLKQPLDGRGYAAFLEALLASTDSATNRAQLHLDSSHDTPRLVTLASADFDSVALTRLLAFTFVGAPCVFYGDEVGLAGGHDPGGRVAFPWEHPERWDRRALDLHRALGGLRRRSEALRRGEYATLAASEDVIAFSRATTSEQLVVMVNAGTREHDLDFPGRKLDAQLFCHGSAELARTDRVRLGPRSGAVFRVVG